MRPASTRTNQIRPRRSLTLLVTITAALGSILLAAAPAHANDTVKHVSANGNSIAFSTSDSSRKVSGAVTFTVNRDGNWHISAGAHNSNLLGRWYHWTCDLTWDASKVRHSTADEWVPGKKDRTISAQAYDPSVQADFDTIVDHGRADCDIVIG